MEDSKKNPFEAHVVLVEPEIPQNTGNIARTCGALGCSLHLIEPLGFSLQNRYLRRAGLDYWHLLEVFRYPNLETFFKENAEGKYYFFSRKAQYNYHQTEYQGKSYFIFGTESVGLPSSLLNQYPDQCFRIPVRPQARSLNLANAVALVLYEAYRQNGFPGLSFNDDSHNDLV